MIVPIDMMTATQDAIIALLRDQLPEDQRGMARHSLDVDARPPFHLVGDIDSASEGSKDDQLERLTADLHTVYQGDDRRVLLGLMHQARLATDGAVITVSDAQLRVAWIGSAASTAAGDGVTYVGLTTLEIFAEPA